MKQLDESKSRVPSPGGADASPGGGSREGLLQRVVLAVTEWSERRFPDAFVFTALAVLVVAAGALSQVFLPRPFRIFAVYSCTAS